MSVPHLDTRVVDGGTALLFGPYAGWSMKFLKHGSWTDLLRSIRPGNLVPMLAVGVRNLDLVKYLVGEVTATDTDRLRTLRAFMPTRAPARLGAHHRRSARPGHQEGQGARAACSSSAPSSSPSADGSIAGLLGASPGASTAVATMLDLLERCFPERVDAAGSRACAR